MKKMTAYITVSIGAGLVLAFQNFTIGQLDYLNTHPSRRIFPIDDIDFVANTPKSPACDMNIRTELGDSTIILTENPAYKAISYMNLSPNKEKRLITLSPANCVYQGAIEIADDNIELDCQNAYIDGSVLPSKYTVIDSQGKSALRKTSRSGILIGKSFRQKTVNGTTVNTPIQISSSLASALKAENYLGEVTQNNDGSISVDPYVLTAFGASASDSLKALIKDQIVTKNITVRNCRVRNFPVDGIHVSWRMADDLKVSMIPNLNERMTWGTYNVLLENNQTKRNLNVGIYLDDHTHDSIVKNNVVVGNAGTGMYLEYHSYNNTIEKNKIFKNGFLYSASTNTMTRSREGIAIDGSLKNKVIDNAFWDNGKGGVFLYKNCGESGAANATGVAARELGANENLISKNRFYREQVGIWLASRQDATLTRMRCSDSTPYPEKDLIINDQGVQEGPYHKYFLDYARNNTIEANLFTDNAIGVKVADDNNTISYNVFKGSMATLVEVGLSRRFSVLKDPLKNVTVSNSSSYVVPQKEFSLYNFINHPENFVFEKNHQKTAGGMKLACSPVIRSVKAKNHPTATCSFYLAEGSLAEGEISTFRDMTPATVVNGTSGSGEYQCINGQWKEISNNCVFKNP